MDRPHKRTFIEMTFVDYERRALEEKEVARHEVACKLQRMPTRNQTGKRKGGEKTRDSKYAYIPSQPRPGPLAAK